MALTSTFTTISAGQTDSDSPLDSVLMDAIRQDIDVLYEWMGGPTYTPSTSHDHDGVNSKTIATISTGVINETHMNWANANGMTQMTIVSTAASTVAGNVSTAWQTFREFLAYIPPNANNLYCYGYVHRNPSFGQTVNFRMVVNSTASNTVTNNTSAYTISSAMIFDVSALSGPVVCSIQLQAPVLSGEYEAYIDRAVLIFL